VAPKSSENFVHLEYKRQFILVFKSNRQIEDVARTEVYYFFKAIFT